MELPAACPWYVWPLARIFGEHFRMRSEDGVVTGYVWRGKIYVTDYEPSDSESEK